MTQFTESVISDIKNVLDSDLSANLSAIEASYPEIELPDPVAIYEGRMFVIPQFPAIVIWPDDSPGTEGQETLTTDHVITVYSCVTHETDFSDLTLKAWRYNWAVADTVKANCLIGGNPGYFLGFNYDNPWGEQDGGYFEVCGSQFMIKEEVNV